MSSPKRPPEYALAAIDIDETLIGPDRKVGAANRKAIERLQALGCRVVLASGRRHANMLPYYAELGLDDFVVSSQGARVEHATTGKILHRAEIEPTTAASLVAEGLRRGFSVLLWLEDRVFAQERSRWTAAYEKLTDDPVTIADLASLTDRPAEKVIWTADPAVVSQTGRELQGEIYAQVLTTITEPWSLEFSAPDANKRDGVAALAHHLGVPREAVLAFGDGNNDVEMLAWAGMGVAMPHGRPAAHAAARIIAPEGDRESALARGVDQVLRHRDGVMVA
ncbi:Cof-type HAD-IIB family hydrolase [Paludisphaera mucosa]|uniref:Cof-type HAD-IIB family hydrolase n=1 Tax=Paludisphaera mucosa TaxID=3030827 RepID=A0ABT6F7Z2_9BACT|nr:Cof-type HAD-IIB family hydrolase [Paludisphaera mucosa]MDG3003596.1 Cof-type HAD-IIB family hydrolase [Paludisphaera mucosa]